MKFNIWTFLFQIINFIVLLFILKRLLYKPVREILEKRRERIRKSMEDAEKTMNEARELKESHERKLRDLDEQKVRMLDEMRGTVLEEKKRLLAEADKEAKIKVEMALSLFEVEKIGFEHQLKEQAVETVRLYASNMLRDIADEELHRSIWRRFLGELGTMAGEIVGKVERENSLMVELASAFPTAEEDLGVLRKALEGHLGKRVTINQEVDPTLTAGVRLRARDMVFDYSLAGQINALGTRLKESA